MINDVLFTLDMIGAQAIGFVLMKLKRTPQTSWMTTSNFDSPCSVFLKNNKKYCNNQLKLLIS